MARVTRDREDLLLEATALVPRVMLRMALSGEPCEVFAGFRGASLSIYFGSAPVYHFNGAGELRRAFVDDTLIKAAGRQLVATVRERSDTQVVLTSRPLLQQEIEPFAEELNSRLAVLHGKLESGEFELAGQLPDDGDAVTRLRDWLSQWSGLKIAAAANVN